jgi:hypothetical protein
MNTIAFLEETAGNVRISLRTLRRNLGFALTAVLVLALGLGPPQRCSARSTGFCSARCRMAMPIGW